MKAITFLLAILISVCLLPAQKNSGDSPQHVRLTCQLNTGWTFNYFDPETADKGYEQPGFNDSRWPAVSLPHTWNSYETNGVLTPFTRSPGENGDIFWWTGWGWYRKHFRYTGPLAAKSVFLEFDGVQRFCRVWINGKAAGEHKGGLDPFDLDITALLKPGEDNVIAVAVSNLQKEEFRVHPLTEGTRNTSCGITGKVRLVEKNRLYIPMQGSALHEGGVQIVTGTGTDGSGNIRILTWVKSELDQPGEVIVRSSVLDRDGRVLKVLKTEIAVSPGQISCADQPGETLENIHRWSPSDPYCYKLCSEILDKKGVTDSLVTFFGFRAVSLDATSGSLILNGEKSNLRGQVFSPEYPWLGDAIPDWIISSLCSSSATNHSTRLLRMYMKPANGYLLELADKNGTPVEEDLGALSDPVYTPEEQKGQLTAVLRRDRNHPSLVSRIFSDNDKTPMSSGLSENGNILSGPVLSGYDSSKVPLIISSQASHGQDPPYTGGKPAKVILEVSHRKVTADRGSVIAVEASIADSSGVIMPAQRVCLHWTVTGPGRLVGPAFYASYEDSLKSPADGYYLRTPAVNMIRCTGKPGKISVRVYASGLSSGEAEIETVPGIPDQRLFTEPILTDDGRRPVSRTNFLTGRLDETPEELRQTVSGLDFGIADSAAYQSLIRQQLKRENPAADTTSDEFAALTSLFTYQLMNCRGRLSAGDYNFNAGQYNTCRLISGYITRTKLPPLFKDKLKKYYADIIIKKGFEKNPGDEMNWLNWIPSGGVVVLVTDSKPATIQKGVVYVRNADLSSIISSVYPQFAKFSEDARARALLFISRMNPSIHQSGTVSAADTAPEVRFTAGKNEPVLVPEFKFISE